MFAQRVPATMDGYALTIGVFANGTALRCPVCNSDDVNPDPPGGLPLMID